ncbi:MAG TPA: hypothetical protein VF901_24950 [Bradyrhizobium sp.]
MTTESEIDAAFAHLAERRPARFSLILMHSCSADAPSFSVWQNAMLFPPFSIGRSTPEAGGCEADLQPKGRF